MSLGELRIQVIERDRQCVAALLDLTHLCRDQWGQLHDPDALGRLTLEHVKLDGRRIDHPHHCVAMCSGGNVMERWSSPLENNRLANAYLAGVRLMDEYLRGVRALQEGRE